AGEQGRGEDGQEPCRFVATRGPHGRERDMTQRGPRVKGALPRTGRHLSMRTVFDASFAEPQVAPPMPTVKSRIAGPPSWSGWGAGKGGWGGVRAGGAGRGGGRRRGGGGRGGGRCRGGRGYCSRRGGGWRGRGRRRRRRRGCPGRGRCPLAHERASRRACTAG